MFISQTLLIALLRIGKFDRLLMCPSDDKWLRSFLFGFALNKEQVPKDTHPAKQGSLIAHGPNLESKF